MWPLSPVVWLSNCSCVRLVTDLSCPLFCRVVFVCNFRMTCCGLLHLLWFSQLCVREVGHGLFSFLCFPFDLEFVCLRTSFAPCSWGVLCSCIVCSSPGLCCQGLTECCLFVCHFCDVVWQRRRRRSELRCAARRRCSCA